MFYDHKILTDRRYGMATIWTLAHLGLNSTLKKVSRRDILHIDIPKACATIEEPEAPLALRLQGNLLFGVSRAYSQQCIYVLSDAQSVRASMRTVAASTTRATNLDITTRKARPEELILLDDPAFVPAINLPFVDLEVLLEQANDINRSITQDTLLSSHKGSSIIQSGDDLGLIIPSDTVNFGDSHMVSHPGGSILRMGGNATEDDVVLEADFDFDEDFNIIDLPSSSVVAFQPPVTRPLQRKGIDEEQAQVSREYMTAQADMDNLLPMDDEMDLILPVVEGNHLPTSSQQLPTEDDSKDADFQPTSSSHVDLSRVSVSARLRRTRPRGFARLNDTQIEIRNRDLLALSENYIQRMRDSASLNLARRMPAQARRNAEHWTLNVGLFGTGLLTGRGDLARFSGKDLFEMVTGSKLSRGFFSKKRGKEEEQDDDGSDKSGRRVRTRDATPLMEEDGILRIDDDGLIPQDNLNSDHPEFLRAGVSFLGGENYDDEISAMPWNVSASLRGSYRDSSVQRITGVSSIPASARGSRLVSASPGIARPAPVEELQTVEDIERMLEHSGEGTTALSSLHLHDMNFLDYVRDAMRAKDFPEKAFNEINDAILRDSSVKFDEVFPPGSTTIKVAVQAFLHVLTFGSKNVLRMKQGEAYGEISISLF